MAECKHQSLTAVCDNKGRVVRQTRTDYTSKYCPDCGKRLLGATLEDRIKRLEAIVAGLWVKPHPCPGPLCTDACRAAPDPSEGTEEEK